MLAAAYDFFASLTYPPKFSLWLTICGAVFLLLRWRKSGLALVAFAGVWSLLWSIPLCSDWLRSSLESRYPNVVEATLPQSGAIVVLGGGTRYDWLEQGVVRPELLPSSRLAAGARAWLSGRAPIIILSGGGENGHSEAKTMAAAIVTLGIPASALVLEERSTNTRDNALFTAKLAEQRGTRRVLLVTSSLHMPRAALLFHEAGLEVVPVPVPERAVRRTWKDRWLPTRAALWRSGRALKEYAGLLVAHAWIAFNAAN